MSKFDKELKGPKAMSKTCNLVLRELTEEDEQAFLKGAIAWKGEELTWYSFEWTPGMKHAAHLEALEKAKDKAQMPQGRVPSTMLYAFVDGEIVGRFSVRHELNDSLKERGGHIGYSISPKHRQKGYATEMFRQGKQFCKSLWLTRILITCADSNEASCRLIEKFGAKLENKVFDEKAKETVRRYWLEI